LARGFIGWWSAPTFLMKRGKRGFKPRSSKGPNKPTNAPIARKRPPKWVRFFERPNQKASSILYTD
jgi:hypothetical protein